ncbi:hypothetical protein [Bradyrhizobium sp. AZCC 2289]|uniref:hypothetical protein n=1 Tax=Bradyrhizobium sp. AZCC 2289 TaxID=3117026 RepID=UPI002FEEA378
MRRWRTDGFTRRDFVAATLAGFVAAGWQHGAYAESSAPIVGTFSRAGLDRVGDYVRNEISTGKIPGSNELKALIYEAMGR